LGFTERANPLLKLSESLEKSPWGRTLIPWTYQSPPIKISVMNPKETVWKEAKEHGIDLSLLKSNLKRSPTERLRAMQEFANFTEALRKSGQHYYDKLRKND